MTNSPRSVNCRLAAGRREHRRARTAFSPPCRFPHNPPPTGAGAERGEHDAPPPGSEAAPSLLRRHHLPPSPQGPPALSGPSPFPPLTTGRGGRTRGVFCRAGRRRRRREPFLCVERKGRPPPARGSRSLSPPDARHRGFKNNRHGGGNAAMTGSRSARPGCYHMACSVPLAARLPACLPPAILGPPSPLPDDPPPPLPFPPPPRSPSPALQQGPERETPCAGARREGRGEREEGASRCHAVNGAISFRALRKKSSSTFP